MNVVRLLLFSDSFGGFMMFIRKGCWWHSANFPDKGEVWEEHRNYGSGRGQVSVSQTWLLFSSYVTWQSMVKNVYTCNLKILNIIQVLNYLQSFGSTQSVFQLHFQLEIRGMNSLFKNEFYLQFRIDFSNWLSISMATHSTLKKKF